MHSIRNLLRIKVTQYEIDELDVRSWHSVVGVETGHTGWTIQGSNPVRNKIFFLLQIAQTGSGAHQTSYLISTGVLSQGKVTGA